MLDRSFLIAVTVLLICGCVTRIDSRKSDLNTEESSISLSDGRILENVRVFAMRPSVADMTILGISVEASTLDDVEKRIGKGIMFQEGEAAANVLGRCFKGSDGTILAFESGEMGGSNHVVLRVQMVDSNKLYSFSKYCAESKQINRNLKFGNGIGLSTSKGKLQEIKGQPSKVLANTLIYAYQARTKTQTRSEDMFALTEAEFENDRAIRLIVSKVTETY